MEEKLVRVLLDQYREQGIDMYALLDDAFFKGLSLSLKVDLIKKHAAEIRAGSHSGITTSDKKAIAFDAGFSGLSAGIAAGLAAKHAARYFVEGHLPAHIIGGAALLGAGVGAGASYLNSRKSIRNKDEILKRIDRTINDPTDENALSVMVSRNNQTNPIITDGIKSTAKNHMQTAAMSIPGLVLGHVSPVANYLSFKHHWRNVEGDYTPGVTEDMVDDQYRRSGEAMNESFTNSTSEMMNKILGKNKE